MKNLLRFILLSPIFGIFILFDIIKFPLVIFLYLPIGIIFWLASLLRGKDDFPFGEFLFDFFFMGCKSCKMIWKGF